MKMGRRAAMVTMPVLIGGLVGPLSHPSAAAPTPPAGAAGGIRIEVLSNRADLVSGGDALVEIDLPDDGSADRLEVDVDGRDATDAFARRNDGRILGVVDGLVPGDNVVTARLAGGRGARLTVTNHPAGGPVLSGPQVQPWSCATEDHGLGPARDDQCNTTAVFELHYRSAVTGQFAPYDPQNPPPDVAATTTDQGRTVPYIVRVERGSSNRGVYAVAVLFDPDRDEQVTPWTPPSAFNGKVLVPFGGDCQPRHGHAGPENVLNHDALSRGFLVMTSSLNVLGQNCNDVVSAEALMMLKEHVVETYGEIRYTMSTGCSGGSMQQHWIVSNYPGLLDGIMPSCSYPDIWLTMQEAQDCNLMDRVFDTVSPHLWLVVEQQAVAAGYAAPTTCRSLWDAPVVGTYARIWLDPDDFSGCIGLGATAGLVDERPDWVYDAETNPTGARCTLQDYGVAVWGRRPPEVWTDVEQQIGRGFANRPYDNVGLQYGLTALQSGEIIPEQFVDLNENAGGIDIDWNWQPERSVADPAALEVAYSSGRVTFPREAAKVPIIDLRGSSNLEIHTDHHSYVMRQRLVDANGHHDNQVIWTSAVPLAGDPAGNLEAFVLVDRWLTAIEADGRDVDLEEKVLDNRPADAVDACWVGGQRITDMSVCRAAYPYFADPRLAAGSPGADNILKCQLRPLDRDDHYGPVPFTDEQWQRMEATFPDGVCDWSQPGVSQQPSVPWLTYASGPGGQALGEAPVSEPFNVAAPAAERPDPPKTRPGSPPLPATGGSGALLAGLAMLAVAFTRTR